MSAKAMMCANSDCARSGERVTVLGGCDTCLGALVPWRDPNVPTIEQIAFIVEDVARLEGRAVPRREIERILRTDPGIHDQWLKRLAGIDWKHRLSEIAVEGALLAAAVKAAKSIAEPPVSSPVRETP